MFTRDELPKLALDAMRETNARLAAVLERQCAVDEARIALERERFAAERADLADRQALLASLHAKAAGDDLPAEITATIRQLAGTDAALTTQLVTYARTRVARDIPVATVLREIRQGDRPALVR